MKGLVLGLGNDILTDDGVGLVLTRRLRDVFKDSGSIDFIETNEMGLSLLDFLEGYQWAVIIDAIVTGTGKPGTLYVLEKDIFQHPQAGNPHHMGLDEILDVAEKMDLSMPEDLFVMAVEAKDLYSFSEELTPELEDAIPELLAEIAKIIDEECLKHSRTQDINDA